MINLLASPSVCVIDDEMEEYEVIISALNKLCVPIHHIKGTEYSQLPEKPLQSIRLVFQDLHLGGETGKNAASRAAGFFVGTVSPETAPVIVVIWSKHIDESLDIDGEPAEDQPTVSDHFKKEVLAANPAYESRLIFIEMKKPRAGERPEQEQWIQNLISEIQSKLSSVPATSLLWEWEQMVKTATSKVAEQLVSFSTSVPSTLGSQNEAMMALLSSLASALAEGDLDEQTAPRHISSALSQLLADQLDHDTPSDGFQSHGKWLSQKYSMGAETAVLNSLLITSECNTDGTSYAPGNVYRIEHKEIFSQLFDQEIGSLKYECFYAPKPESQEEKKQLKEIRAAWQSCVEPVLIELSPVCDVAHQGKRITATLIAGLIVPANLKEFVKSTGACHTLPNFTLRKAGGSLAANTEVTLALNSKYRTALPSKSEDQRLVRWFRIRELPTASIRTWLAAQISRIGYVAL